MTEGERETLRYVRDAIARVPQELSLALECPLPRVTKAPRSVVTTGIGASEGPARILAASLAEAGMAARFCPISSFVLRARAERGSRVDPRGAADLLVVFSQGLSPNARLALGSEHAFSERWLVTSFTGSADCSTSESKRAAFQGLSAEGVTAIVTPPANEPESLARFCGPTVAALMALRLAALLTGDRALAMRLVEAPSIYLPAPFVEPLPAGPLALVTAGALAESAYAQRWKLLEALLREDPPVWDVLQFAHGPLQAFHDKPLTLLVLETPSAGDLVQRLLRTLDATHHRVLRLVASLPAPLSFFQHTAQLDALLLASLEVAPRDLFNWPGRHGDAPLYALGEGAGREPTRDEL
jgi:creatinine amidohydrolase